MYERQLYHHHIMQRGLDTFSWSQRTWRLNSSFVQTALDFDTPARNAIRGFLQDLVGQALVVSRRQQ